MHILTLTSLFPNPRQPIHGIFIRNRMEAFARKYGADWSVVAPVPWFPKLPFKTGSKYDLYPTVAAYEEPWGYPIHHPRYLVTPKVGMRYYGTWMAAAVRKTVREIHKRKPIDFIDCHYIFPDGNAGAAMSTELGIPMVISARGTDLNLYPGFPAIRPQLQANLRASRHLICVCSELRDVALELGLPRERISVIGNGVDLSMFAKTDKAEARRKLGLPGDKRIILSVGHLIERKGFHLVLDAFAGLSAPDAFLVIAGGGEEDSALKAQAKRLGLEGRVKFTGALVQKDLPLFYSAADFFILASSREGWPNVVCEAQAMGLPVIATRVWGTPEIITDDSLGVLVDKRDAPSLREGMAKALGKTWDIARIESAGRARTWEKVAEKMAPIFGL